jgi:hypothetical protein
LLISKNFFTELRGVLFCKERLLWLRFADLLADLPEAALSNHFMLPLACFPKEGWRAPVL